MIPNIKEAKKFDSWLRKRVKNIHSHNNEKMLKAYERVEALKYNPVN